MEPGPLNCKHDQNFAEKPVVRNLLHAFNLLTHSIYFISKSNFKFLKMNEGLTVLRLFGHLLIIIVSHCIICVAGYTLRSNSCY